MLLEEVENEMQVIEGQTSSNATQGCVDLEWLAKTAKNIYSTVAGFIFNAINIARNIGNLISGGIRGLINLGKQAISGGVQLARGAIVSLVRAANDLCGRALGRTAVFAGVIVGGTYALIQGAAVAAPIVTAALSSKIVLAVSGFTVARLAQHFLSTAPQFIYNFNWNISDTEIKSQQENALISLYSVAGDTLGTTLGSLACGFLPGAAIATINPMMMARLIEIAGDDIKDELVSAWWSFAKVSQRFVAQKMFFSVYKNTRALIKKFAAGQTWLATEFPWLSRAIENWGEVGSKPWSFASSVEEYIESIPDQKKQVFTENFIEQAMDSCTESALAISYSF